MNNVLHKLFKYSSDNIIRYVIDHGIGLNPCDEYENRPIYYAFQSTLNVFISQTRELI